MHSNPPIWTDDGGNRHVLPNMRDLLPLLQLGIKRMGMAIALSTTIREGSQPTNHHQAQRCASATEAVDIILCVLLTRLRQDEIDRHPDNEKRRFVARWFDLQKSLFGISA
jgi:hypothetical protein